MFQKKNQVDFNEIYIFCHVPIILMISYKGKHKFLHTPWSNIGAVEVQVHAFVTSVLDRSK